MSGAPLRLLADRMYVRLGRWLRAAGYDTAIAPADAHVDRTLVDRALAERRWLVTRDRKMTEFAAAPRCVVLLEHGGVAAAAAELTARLGLDWLAAPFTRCLDCNLPVEPADAATVRAAAAPALDAIDPDAVAPLTRCPGCGRVYWRGGHVRRMHARLERWQSGNFD